MREGLKKAGFPADAIQLVEDTTRESAYELMKARGYVDLLIPRGGKGLISACVENATVPCIETGTGICHVYVDRAADIDMALTIIDNAKTSRPSVCNAAEVCLVNEAVAEEFLPKLKSRLCDGREHPVEFICDEKAYEIIGGTKADEESFDTEFLDYKLAVKIVSSVEEACEHIARHSTMHSEAIITNDDSARDYFFNNVDSAALYHNASTRFTDGGVFGLGCEMGISTQKMHARGPMGIEELCSYKYVIRGNGQVR
jgi:glutamate-5-semialdehyde dehydrogenase